jgi:hypothetical protein
MNGHRATVVTCPKSADFVAEVGDEDSGPAARTRLLMR